MRALWPVAEGCRGVGNMPKSWGEGRGGRGGEAVSPITYPESSRGGRASVPRMQSPKAGSPEPRDASVEGTPQAWTQMVQALCHCQLCAGTLLSAKCQVHSFDLNLVLLATRWAGSRLHHLQDRGASGGAELGLTQGRLLPPTVCCSAAQMAPGSGWGPWYLPNLPLLDGTVISTGTSGAGGGEDCGSRPVPTKKLVKPHFNTQADPGGTCLSSQARRNHT
jgi:hypothetical protein